jgi:tetratricopeptide (TPR) repeat protein
MPLKPRRGKTRLLLMSRFVHVVREYRRELFVSGLLILLALLVYWPTFGYPFVNYDDPGYVSTNARVQAGLTSDGVLWSFTTFRGGNWHPLTWLSLQLDATLYGGQNAGGFHATNVVLHTLNTLLLFGVLRGLTGAVWRSGVVAALFGLHPLHVESVAWVSERKDVLSTLFWMLALAAYLAYVRRPGLGRYLLVVLALGLGLLAKAMLVTLPCVLLLLDYWPLCRWAPGAAWLRLLREKIPLFALVLGACLVTFLAQFRGLAVAAFESVPLSARLGNALVAYVGYLGKMLWPLDLAAFYPHPRTDLGFAEVLGAGLLLAVVTWLVLVPGRRWPYLGVGWLWYLGTLVPVIGLVQVGSQAMADRYTYVPLIGVFVALVWGVSDLALAWHLRPRYLAAATAVVLSACAALAAIQTRYWRDSQALWEHATAVTGPNVLTHYCLGQRHYAQGDRAAAVREFEQAAALDPNHLLPHLGLGLVFAELGRLDQAEAEYRRVIALDGRYAVAHFNLGSLLATQARHEEAMAHLREAIALDPEIAWAHTNLGSVLWQVGRLEEALAEFRQAIALDPTATYPHTNLGSVLSALGRNEEALVEYRTAIALAPRDALSHRNLGNVLQDEGRLDEALAAYRKAGELGDSQAASLMSVCERLRALRPRLAGLSAGGDRPADNAERLAFAELCRQRRERRYALAVRLYAEAFRADPRLAEDRGVGYRFRAATAAAAGGCGRDAEGAGLSEGEQAELRQQALTWLQSDLALWARQAESELPEGRVAVQQAMRLWQRNADLAGVRTAAALAQRPAAEREAWQQLWQQVEAVLNQAKATTAPGGSPGSLREPTRRNTN